MPRTLEYLKSLREDWKYKEFPFVQKYVEEQIAELEAEQLEQESKQSKELRFMVRLKTGITVSVNEEQYDKLQAEGMLEE